MSARDALLSQLAEWAHTSVANRPALVAIDGVDGAGKSTFSNHLATALSVLSTDVVQVSMDGFHNRAAVRYRRANSSPAASYYEDSFDYGAFARCVVDPIRGGAPRSIIPTAFDHTTDSQSVTEPVAVGDDALVLVDGIFLGRPELIDSWDCWIYLYAEPEVARARGVKRDELRYGAATRDRYLTRYEPGQALYHGAVDPAAAADIVIDNTDPETPRVVRMGGS